MEIRRAVEGDREVLQVLNEGLYEYENRLGFYQDLYGLDWTRSQAGAEYFASLLGSRDDRVAFVAEEQGRAVGYLAASLSSPIYRSKTPIAEIDNMFVLEASRRSGVGASLVEAFVTWARGVGAQRVKVAAFSDNEAVAFYRGCGFGDHEIVLEAPL